MPFANILCLRKSFFFSAPVNILFSEAPTRPNFHVNQLLLREAGSPSLCVCLPGSIFCREVWDWVRATVVGSHWSLLISGEFQVGEKSGYGWRICSGDIPLPASSHVPRSLPSTTGGHSTFAVLLRTHYYKPWGLQPHYHTIALGNLGSSPNPQNV